MKHPLDEVKEQLIFLLLDFLQN